jgi:MFS family permease
VCGASNSVELLIGARAVQALGGAMLVPASLALVLPEFPLERRATATALWGVVRVRSFAVANAGGFVFALGFYALLLCNVL